MQKIQWIEPWMALERPGTGLNAELGKEVPPGHSLHGRSAEAIGHRIDCDDVLFVLDDNTLAVVHLTWSGRQEHHLEFPWTNQFQTVDDFVKQAMLLDAKEYGSLTQLKD